MDFVFIVNQILLVLTVIAQIITVVLIASFFVEQKNVLDFFQKYSLHLVFAVAFIATVGSLFYSEVAGYEPCKLCWFQRILMYPQTIILAIALFKKDKGIVPYIVGLSAVGAVISGYHYLLQLGIFTSGSCSTVGYSVNCAKLFVMGFGYITIPMMAFTAFLLIIISMIILKLNEKQNY